MLNRPQRVSRKLLRLSMIMLLVMVAAATAPVVLGQGGAGDSSTADQGSSASSVADMFFIARKASSVDDGEKSIEILGSLIIWFLLLLSMLSIGLIGQMALTNQRKSIVPQGVVDEVRAMLEAGRYREAIELTGKDESFFSRVLHAALREANHGFGSVIRALEQTSD